MNENQFSAMLAIIVPKIVEQIVKNSNISEVMGGIFIKNRSK